MNFRKLVLAPEEFTRRDWSQGRIPRTVHTKRFAEQVVLTCPKNSNQFEFVGLAAWTKLWSVWLGFVAKMASSHDLWFIARHSSLVCDDFHANQAKAITYTNVIQSNEVPRNCVLAQHVTLCKQVKWFAELLHTCFNKTPGGFQPATERFKKCWPENLCTGVQGYTCSRFILFIVLFKQFSK